MSSPHVLVQENGVIKAIIILQQDPRPPFKLNANFQPFGDVTFRIFNGEEQIPIVDGIAVLPITSQAETISKASVFSPKRKILPKGRVNGHSFQGHITFVSTWGIDCGIATYTSFLSKALLSKNLQFQICRNISEINYPTVIHTQQEFGIFPKADMIVNSSSNPKVITWHTVFKEPRRIALAESTVAEYAEKVDAAYDCHIVHNSLAKTWLMQFCSKPIYVIPHGSVTWPAIGKKNARNKLGLTLDDQILFAFGFSADSKGFTELCQTFRRLKQTFPRLALIISGAIHAIAKEESGRCLARVKASQSEGITVLGRYLTEDEINLYAEAADILVFNYYGGEGVASASGAVHRVLASGNPIVCSEDSRTLEFQDGVHCLKYPMGDLASLESELEVLLTEHDLAEELGKNAALLAQATSWEVTALRHMQVYSSLTEGEELFGSGHYDQEYYVGNKGGLSYISQDGKIKQWSYYNPDGEWTGCKPIMEAIKAVFNPENMLDCGCGRGTFCAYARDLGITSVGIDFSEWAINNPYPRAKGLTQLGDVRDIKFPDNSFDFVLCTDIMEHIFEEDLDKVIHELQRVSRKWIFYNIGSPMGEGQDHFVLKKGEVPPVKWQGTTVAGHVNVRPPSYWRKRLSNKNWLLRDDAIQMFRCLVPADVLKNWICVIATSKVDLEAK